MKIEDIDVNENLKSAQEMLEKETGISPAFKAILEVLFLIITLLVNRLNLNSSNSSKPPSSDPNRKKNKTNKSKNKPGGQRGHVGSNLNPVAEPDEIKRIKLDKKTLPKAVNSNGAVSPMIRAIDKIMPDKIPANPQGTITFSITR